MIDIERLKELNPIEDVVTAVTGYELHKSGRSLTPRKGTKEGGLVVSPDMGTYYWNTRGRGGDVISFLENEHGMDFMEAVAFLAERANMPLRISDEQAAAIRKQRELSEVLGVIAKHLQVTLAESKEAVGYCRSRGWTDETIKAAGLGLWDGNKRTLGDFVAMEGVDRNHDAVTAVMQMPGMMLVYVHQANGRVEYLSGRGIREKVHWNLPAKYVGEKRPFWGHAYNRNADFALVVEGQADAVTLAQWGIGAVALAGLSDPDEIAGRLDKHSLVYVALDNDAAADKAIWRIANKLGPMTRVIHWPVKDANDWLQSGATADDCMELLGNAKPFVLYLARKVATASPVQQELAREMTMEVAAKLTDYELGMIRGELLNKAHLDMNVGAFNLARKSLREQARQAQMMASRKSSVQPAVAAVDDVMVHGALLSQPVDHEGHAQCVMLLNPDRFAYVPEWGWLMFDGRMWVKDRAEALVERHITRALRQRGALLTNAGQMEKVQNCAASHRNVTGTKNQLQSAVTMTPGDFNNNPDELNVANGVLNLRTGELKAHGPESRFTYCLDVPYEPEADDVVWLAWLYSAVSDEETAQWLQKVAGYLLTGHTREECFFYLHGPSRSGKGIWLESMLKLMGEPLAMGVDFTTFTADRGQDTNSFDLAPLQPSRLVVASESEAHKRMNGTKMKQWTGGDRVYCSFKGKDHFSYKPSFKIFLASNFRLNMHSDDHAAWGRARVIEFPNSWLGKEDRNLKAGMMQPEVQQGILRWAVDGAMRWYEGGLGIPVKVKDNTEEHRANQDIVQVWLDECAVIADPGNTNEFTPTELLSSSYSTWCKGNGVRAKGRAGFVQDLESKGFEKTKTSHWKFKNPRWGYRGLLLQEYMKPDDIAEQKPIHLA